MRTVAESIKALSRAVQDEARTEADQVLADAKAKAEAIRQRAQEQAAAERAEILEHASADAERIRSQAIATAQLKARTLQLARREKLLDSVFAAARQQVPTVQQWTDYGQIAHHLLQEALTLLGADAAQVRADEGTRAVLTDPVLAEISKELGVQLQFGAPLEQGTGVIVETTDGHRQVDNTLETRLSRLQDALRAPVYHLLTGEPL
jgi:V/A-type H+-transporting ATPase subunit E